MDGATEENEDTGDDEGQESVVTKRRAKQCSADPSATLEASLSALNVKKFDLAFAVDPLFKRTSAQFDEGGAKGVHLVPVCRCDLRTHKLWQPLHCQASDVHALHLCNGVEPHADKEHSFRRAAYE